MDYSDNSSENDEEISNLRDNEYSSDSENEENELVNIYYNLNFKISQIFNCKYNPKIYYNLKLIQKKFFIKNLIILKISAYKYNYELSTKTKKFLSSNKYSYFQKYKFLINLIDLYFKKNYLYLNLYLNSNNNTDIIVKNNKIYIY
tara:strand:+ start:1669 stop:2106 length:438 start_codon:yes stop_codon:yes gene_type:complete